MLIDFLEAYTGNRLNIMKKDDLLLPIAAGVFFFVCLILVVLGISWIQLP
jgi:hypothetical protein